jgi:two-component system phosphate regulon sensor histidine kinase PhoR
MGRAVLTRQSDPMWLRILGFLVLQASGAALGWHLGGLPGLAIGLAAAGLAGMLLDLLSGVRLLRWLRAGDIADTPRMAGLWGEIVFRTRKQLREREKLTQASERRLQEFLAAIQASPNGVIFLDPEGRIEWCNQTASEHFGIDAERDMLQLIGNLVRDPAFASYYTQGEYTRGTTMMGRGGTASRPMRLSVHLHPYGEGRRLLLSTDVTALEQAEAMRRDFVANVSHEIRTPLTVLTGFVETLQSLPLDQAERARYLELMSQQASRMQSLVSDLLTLSRIEGSPPPSPLDWMPVDDLLGACEDEGRALSALLTAGQSAEHILQFDHVPGASLAGSRGELLSAMSNLVSNAVRYTPAGGSIKVSWQALADGRAEFAVRDTGPGIAPEHLPRLTERFYRVDRSRSRETGGTGLGLAIVKHVAQRHGAELQMQSTPGQGSRFSIVFPAARVRVGATSNPAPTVQ